MGCRLTTLMLFLIMYLSISFCFIVTKIALCSCQFGRSPFQIPRRLFIGAAARISIISRCHRFQSGIDPPNMYNPGCVRYPWCQRRGKVQIALLVRVLSDVCCTYYYYHIYHKFVTFMHVIMLHMKVTHCTWCSFHELVGNCRSPCYQECMGPLPYVNLAVRYMLQL
jgi:hypothetical protein